MTALLRRVQTSHKCTLDKFDHLQSPWKSLRKSGPGLPLLSLGGKSNSISLASTERSVPGPTSSAAQDYSPWFTPLQPYCLKRERDLPDPDPFVGSTLAFLPPSPKAAQEGPFWQGRSIAKQNVAETARALHEMVVWCLNFFAISVMVSVLGQVHHLGICCSSLALWIF